MVILKFNLTTIIKQIYTALDRPLWFQEVEAPRICRQSVHEDRRVVRPRYLQPSPQEIFLVITLVLLKLSRHQGRSVAASTTLMKNPNNPIGTRIRDILTYKKFVYYVHMKYRFHCNQQLSLKILFFDIVYT